MKKSIVLMDTNRLTAIKVSCNFWIEEGNMQWNCGDSTFKFIVTTDHTLVIGPICNHKSVYAVYATQELPVDEAKSHIKEIEKKNYLPFDCPIIAAGTVSFDGRITEWRSDGFRVETPHDMRETIQQEIARLFQTRTLKLV